MNRHRCDSLSIDIVCNKFQRKNWLQKQGKNTAEY